MSALLSLARGLERPVLWTGRIGAYALVPLVAITLLHVVIRKITPLKKWIATSGLNDFLSSVVLHDAEWHAHTLLFASAIAFAYLRNAHVRVDIFHCRFSPRRQACIEAAGGLCLLLPFALMMLRNSIDFVAAAYRSGEQSATLMGIGQTWIIKSAFVLCFLMLALAALATVLRAVRTAVAADPSDPHHREAGLTFLSPGDKSGATGERRERR